MKDYSLFLEFLSCSIHGKKTTRKGSLSIDEITDLLQLAKIHKVLPLISECIYWYLLTNNIRKGVVDTKTAESNIPKEKVMNSLRKQARKETINQAQRSAAFLELYQYLAGKGLQPVVMKGIICRDLYPNPEQRPSVDEDLLVPPEDFDRYHHAFLEYGLTTTEPVEKVRCGAKGGFLRNDFYELAYKSPNQLLCVELHISPFPLGSESYGDCNRFFAKSYINRIQTRIYGVHVSTLEYTDHLLYMICHAYKHFLHGGFGIRQVCDILSFSDRYTTQIDWPYIRGSCEEIRIMYFTSAIYRIGEKHLDFTVPKIFCDIEVDESDLLEDILTGGIYGVEDINRAHSSTLTLDAVASQKKGKRSVGPLHSVFLPLNDMKGKYPYLERCPVLLPFAWGQRVIRYLGQGGQDSRKKPGETLKIGQERIKLLKKYGIID